MVELDQVLVVVLGDQLTPRISSLRGRSQENTVVFMAEVMAETTYAAHHKKKLVLVLSAMRHFAEHLKALGWRVDYVRLEDDGNTGNLSDEIERAKKRHNISTVVMTEPAEWRLKNQLAHIEQLEDTRFICSHASFQNWATGRKEMRMEFFYRDMRRQTKLLMDGDQPEGGQWNFDSENRKPADSSLFFPKPKQFAPDVITQDVIALVKRKFAKNFGTLEPFWFAVTAADAEKAAEDFIAFGLAGFGATQDAMLQNNLFLNHSVLSPYINLGLLDPLDLCRKVAAEYNAGRITIAAAEGFIRQVIGWREYIRGVYWLKMPDYAHVNALNATRPLPDFYWTADTPMNCVAHVVSQTREEAYAHHIQRLMITGNFALLAGLDPHAVHEWYLAVYIDAFEWVELPNTIGMALHADGGLLASKPYAASGNYINKMSDYCGSCQFDVKQRTGSKACPFNALYWNFIATHFERFRRNPRMAQTCTTYNRFADDEKMRISESANAFLNGLKAAEY
jgi:deoxyribodipyrimidine photolyase-related protein